MDMITSQGMSMPKLGLGTFRMQGEACERAVTAALAMGYRHIDTAQMYANEDAVGRAIARSGVPRSTLHVTTKVWWTNLAPDAMRRAMDDSLRLLGLDYVDLYLIHWPAPDMNLGQAIDTLVSFRDAGLAKAIGVANFPSAMLRAALATGAPIATDQVEYHVGLDQTAILDVVRAHGISLTAYCPLAQGRLAEHPVLTEIARKHAATAAQVALRWLLDQDGVAAIPKSSRADGQRANLEALRIVLDGSDRAAIAKLPKDQRCVNPAFAPQWDRSAAS
ncbi:MAG TPA: aldo/keto reductase [Acidisphaera sp.]|nr:aldo/keto reductase [Acidisphaera sp.]